ncbi:MAG: hypothetical protein R3222_10505, partial [Balneolaceae bacterium]|nr:hypothetical protein [Balneolaceae bacterium]
AVPVLRKWLLPVLNQYQASEKPAIKYLQFEKSPSDLNLNHYYHITSFGDDKVALSFLSTPFGGTRMIAILNREGTNRAVAEVNLDLIFEGEEPDTSIYSAEGVKNAAIAEHIPVDLFDETVQHDIEKISQQMKRLFSKLTNI